MSDREYAARVEELERAFREEREAIEAYDVERMSRLLERIDGLLVRLVEEARISGSEGALRALERASALREGNTMLLAEKVEELREELSGVRMGRRAAAAYRPAGYDPRGRTVDREA